MLPMLKRNLVLLLKACIDQARTVKRIKSESQARKVNARVGQPYQTTVAIGWDSGFFSRLI